MCTTTGEHCSTDKTLFDAANQTLEKQEFACANCTSFGFDNTSTNVDKLNSIKSRALKENNSMFTAGCNCHLVHLAAGQGGKSFAKISGFYMKKHQVVIYHYLNRSTQRKEILKESVKFVDKKWGDILEFFCKKA